MRAAADDEDDDVVMEGRTGDLALSDFPHAREWCLAIKFQPGREQEHCPNCYCFVCDDRGQVHRLEEPLQGGALVPYRQRSGSREVAKLATAHRRARLPARRPRRRRPPPRPRPRPLAANVKPVIIHEWASMTSLKAIEQVYMREQPAPAGLLSSITLRPYQKQSVAFMVDLERSTDATLLGSNGKRGGILADEMGMGKTMIVTALILANPMQEKSTNARPKTTLIYVNNTLVQQWYDEMKWAAPNLKIYKHYASSKTLKNPDDLKDADVLITTPHTKIVPFTDATHFYRLIVDESHLMENSSSSGSWSGKAEHVIARKSTYAWGATGTPISLTGGGASAMDIQMKLIGHGERKEKPGERYVLEATSKYNFWESQANCTSTTRPQTGLKATRKPLQEAADLLKKIMIRHTKAQRIDGEAALALPDADCATVLLDMSADERILYEYTRCREGVPMCLGADRHYGGTATEYGSDLDRLYSKSLEVCAHIYPAQIDKSEPWTTHQRHRLAVPRRTLTSFATVQQALRGCARPPRRAAGCSRLK